MCKARIASAVFSVATVLLYGTVCLQTADAQEWRGSIVGRVLDPTGAAIANAAVRATNYSTNVSTTARSNSQGSYLIPFLNPGTYTLSAEVQGFKAFKRDGIDVRTGDRIGLDIVLEVGVVTQSLVVSAESPVLDTASANVGQVIENRSVSELPLAHGNPRSFIILLPGVNQGFPGGQKYQDPTLPASSSGYTVNGAPRGTTEFTLDGMPNMQTVNADFQSGISNQPPADAIQELKLETAYDAAVGHSSGTHIQMAVKSGTNALHGTGYYFYRGPDLYANGFLANKASQPRPDFNYRRFGGSVSGPFVIPKLYHGKDRTFFFYAVERLTQESPLSAFVGTVPTATQLKGDFSSLLALASTYQIYDPGTIAAAGNGRFSSQPFPGNIVPANRISPIAQALSAYWPSPNLPGTSDGTNNFINPNPSTPSVYASHVLRVDHLFSDRYRLNGHFVTNYKTEGPYRDYFHNIATARNFGADPLNMSLDQVFLLGPATMLDVKYGYQRHPVTSFPSSQGFDLASAGFPSQLLQQLSFRHPKAIIFPQVAVSGVTTMGQQTATRFANDIHALSANLNRPTGAHGLKFGVSARAYRENRYGWGWATPAFSFSTNYTKGPLDNSPSSPSGMGQGMAAFLLGQPTGGSVDYNDSSASQSTYWSGYVQDDWRVSAQLTLSLGLRYEYEGPLSERFNRSVRDFDSSADLPITATARANYAANALAELPASQFQARGGLLFAGVGNQPKALYGGDKNNMMPRIGFAWAIGERTVVRGGYGIFFMAIGQPAQTRVIQPGYNQITQLIPTINNGITFIANLANPFPTGILTPRGNSDGVMTYVGQGVSFFDSGRISPYNQRWNLNVQRLLPGRFLIEAGYVGNRSTQLLVGKDIDALPNQYLSTSPIRDQPVIDRLTSQVPNPFYPMLAGTSLAGQTTSVQQLLRSYPQFTSVSTTTNQGYSWYHATQIRGERRFAQGFTLMLAYTYSKLMEAVSFANAGDPMPYRSISSLDRPHHFSISSIYELPIGRGRALLTNARGPVRWLAEGWQVGLVFQQYSGEPLGFGDVIFNGNIKDIPLPAGSRTVDRWFNTEAGFERSTAKQLSYHYNSAPMLYSGLRADSFENWDISILKNTGITESLKIQFRAEAFNAFNHVTFGPPNTAVTSTAFGGITAEYNLPRQIQFGFKLLF